MEDACGTGQARMIEWWQGTVLALVQGLTEFLPISSSAHLLLPTLLLGWPDQGLAFDVAVHVGTLLAVLWYFRGTLLELLIGVIDGIQQRELNHYCEDVLYLALASLPVAVVGLLLNDHMEQLRRVPVIISTTIVFALLLWWADRRAATAGRTRLSSVGAALFVGFAQALAPIPGTSRSGITMTAGLLLGLSREAAARFAFLLSIPVIAGAGLLKTADLLAADSPVPWDMLLLGTVVAGCSAYMCIAVFLRVIDRVGMLPFVIYRLLLGAALLAFWWR
jgi:undecaprenyl-diphosphatase